MKNLLKLLCVILAVCMLCSCSKLASDKLDDNNEPDTPPPADTTTQPGSNSDEDKVEEENSEPLDQHPIPETPDTAFHAASDFDEVFSVISGNANIPYGVFPPEANAADGSRTVISLNGSTPLVNVPTTTVTVDSVEYTMDGGTLLITDGGYTASETEVFIPDYTIGGEEDNSTEFSYGYENAAALYLSGSRLSIVTSAFCYNELYDEDTQVWNYSNKNSVNIYIYDVSDPAYPQLVKILSQDGNYISSVMYGGKVYAISSQFVNKLNEDDIASYVPHVYDLGSAVPGSSEETGIVPINAENIHIFEYSTCAGYTILAEYDIEAAAITGSSAVLGGNGRLYIDETDIYMVFFSETAELFGTREEESGTVEEYTEHCISAVIKFSMADGCTPVGTSVTEGCFTGDFSIYSSEGNLYFCAVAEKSYYEVHTDSESGWVQRKDISAKVENLLYAFSPDLTAVIKYNLPDDEISYASFSENLVTVGYLNEDISFDITSGQAVLS